MASNTPVPDDDEEPELKPVAVAWREYEKYIFERVLKDAGDGAKVEADCRRLGRKSGVDRQIDIYAVGPFGRNIQQGITAMFDCKRYSRKVNVKHVDAFIGMWDDVGTHLAFIVTTAGFTPAAQARADAAKVFAWHIPEEPKHEYTEEELDALFELAYTDPENVFYSGQGYDHEPYGDIGAVVAYSGISKPSVVAAGPGVDWTYPEGLREVATAILRHYLGDVEPDPDVVDRFIANEGDRFDAPFEFPESVVEKYAGEQAEL